jgi:hypothetical protein
MAGTRFLLSDFTEGVWLAKGGLQLRRIKEEEDDFDSGYKIYVPYQSLRAIVSKRETIKDSANDVAQMLVESPMNIVLYKRQVLRLSLFYEELYYGLHVLEGDGRIAIGMGMNLSEIEYSKLLEKLLEKFQSTSTSTSPNPDGSNDAEGEGSESEAQPSRKRRRKQATLKPLKVGAGEMKDLFFPATLYGWFWYSDTGAQYVPTKETAGQWHFNAKDCFFEATACKPHVEGEHYQLDVFDKTQQIAVNTDFLDAAFAKLIQFNASLCAQEDKINSLYSASDMDDLDAYGKIAFERIPLSDIYELCRKAVSHYTPLSKPMELFLMKKATSYEKVDSVLSMMKTNSLDHTLLDLMDYIYNL